MELIIKIAWRNVLRHRGKSFIIGAILFIGALLMTVGNGVIAGLDRGLQENIVNGFLGDIVIVSEKETSDSVMMKMMGQSVPSFPNYKEIKKILDSQDYIKENMPVGKNATMVINEDEGDAGYSILLGVDIDKYMKFFPDNITFTEGKVFPSSATGIVLPEKARTQLYDQMNIWFLPRDGKIVEKNLSDDAKKNTKDLSLKRQVVLMGMSESGNSSDVRLDIRGVFKYRALNTIWGHFCIMDIDSYRQCLGYFAASDRTAELPKEKQKLLSMDDSNIDAMFGSGDFIVADTGKADTKKVNFKKKEIRKALIDPEIGAYNLIFVKLKNSRTLDTSILKLNKTLADSKLGVRAVSWKKASGVIGSMAVIIKTGLFAFVLILFFVAVIIIVNTLTMAAIERSSEIGMMRAIGARRSFISGMFLGETAVLSFLFGGLGVIAGTAAVKIIPLLKITTTNDFLQLIYGGDTFRPSLSSGDLVLVVIELAVVTLVTALYPVKVANSITPLDAISRD